MLGQFPWWRIWRNYSRIAPDHGVVALLQELPLAQEHRSPPVQTDLASPWTCFDPSQETVNLVLCPCSEFLSLSSHFGWCYKPALSSKAEIPGFDHLSSPPLAVNTILMASLGDWSATSLASCFCTLFIVRQYGLLHFDEPWGLTETSCSGAPSNLCTTKTSGHSCPSGPTIEV